MIKSASIVLKNNVRLIYKSNKYHLSSISSNLNIPGTESLGDKALRRDVRKLGQTLGEAIKAESEEVYEAVERLRHFGREVSLLSVVCCLLFDVIFILFLLSTKHLVACSCKFRA
jgi:hypothetical protein